MKKQALKKIIKDHGSAYRAAKSLGISPQSFYEQMKRQGLTPQGYKLMKGEPQDKSLRKSYYQKELKEAGSIPELARRWGRSPTAVREKLMTHGVDIPKRHLLAGEPEEADKKKVWLGRLLKKHGNGNQVARELGISSQAVYERMERYGLKEE